MKSMKATDEMDTDYKYYLFIIIVKWQYYLFIIIIWQAYLFTDCVEERPTLIQNIIVPKPVRGIFEIWQSDDTTQAAAPPLYSPTVNIMHPTILSLEMMCVLAGDACFAWARVVSASPAASCRQVCWWICAIHNGAVLQAAVFVASNELWRSSHVTDDLQTSSEWYFWWLPLFG
jgi:hypothetical protein